MSITVRVFIGVLTLLTTLICFSAKMANARDSSVMPSTETDMVLIPAGEFWMGSDQGPVNERPRHRVYLDAFYIDKFEVTNAQFDRFVKTTGYTPRGNWQETYTPGKENHPVVNVSWYDAVAFLSWIGKRLPTEAEWEKASRGGLVDKRYPWGNSIDSSKANYGHINRGTSAVGFYPANGYGLFDMSGNVFEWVADWYQETYYELSPYRNPEGPSLVFGFRGLRGGAWDVGFDSLRNSYRNWNPPDFWDD